jgi:hypothetical protein
MSRKTLELNNFRAWALPIALGVLAVAGEHAAAQILAEEDFRSYTLPGELENGNGGAGWGGPWTADSAASDLAAGGITVGAAAGAPGSLLLIKNSGPAAFRQLATPFSGDTFFLSFNFSFQTGIVDDGDRAYIFLNSSSGPGVGFSGLGTQDIFGQPKGQDNNQARAGNVAVGQPYSVAVQFSKSVTGSSQLYDTVRLWVNPESADQNSPDAVWTGVGQDSSITGLGILTEQLEEGTDVFAFDRIVIGQTWSDVVPVPEPAAYALLVLGGLILGCVRRRRRAV